VVRTIVSILAAHVRIAETGRTRAKPASSWQAYDYYLKAADSFVGLKSLSVDHLYEARRLLQQSLGIDPSYARSFALLAQTYYAVWHNPVDTEFLNPGARDQAHQFARRAVEIEPNLPKAHAQLGFALMARHEFDPSIAAFERANALNPNFVSWQFGYALVRAGDPRRAIDVLNAYVRLDPLYVPFASGFLGFAHYMLKQYVQALPLLRDCVSRSPNLRGGHVWLAATYAQMGRLEEARAEVTEVMRIEPNYTISGSARPMITFKNPDDDHHYFDGLRKAGLPK
jgi:adenylate cyclase